MTVVLAVQCADGIAIAADSQVTDHGRGMSYPAQKLHDLGDHAAWGGSGARSVLLELETAYATDAEAIIEAENVGRAIQQRTVPILRYHYDTYIEDVPGGEGTGTPAVYVLAAGYSGERPWIVEIDPSGLINHYEDIGFHAIGTGAAMAHQAASLLAHFRMGKRTVEHGVVAVVRVLDALSVTSPSVGGEIDVCRITPEGAHHLDEDELAEVQRGVARWTELEQEALDRLFG